MEQFYEDVFDVVRLIPEGRVSTYGAIGTYLGQKDSRQVGYAMNSAGNATPKVPAHRVVNKEGILTGKKFFNPPSLMQELLETEGIEIISDKIVDFKNLFWDPAIELAIE